jgi:3-phosphoshikimate 1-carboxyvinyltransferase
MRRIIEPLEQMGARVSSNDGRAPLRINGRWPLSPIRQEMAIASAQVKSCILLAGLNAEGRTEAVEETGVTRDHTERMLRWFNVPVEARNETRDGRSMSVIAIDGPARLHARDVAIPGDISSAAFFIVAAALLPNSELQLEAVGLNPTRSQILKTLQAFGLDAEATNLREQGNEPMGAIRVRGHEHNPAASSGTASSGEQTKVGERANILRGPVIARLIDELPVLAVVGTQLSGGLEIREAAELRHKESDRIGAMVWNLRAMGATVEEFADGLRVGGRARLRGARLEARGDHRIAMACAVAALLAEGESLIAGAECARVSFPTFFELLEAVVER